ncbi:MAG: hypothetical protein ACRDUA_00735 [Micromonosporaceae bacterium]
MSDLDETSAAISTARDAIEKASQSVNAALDVAQEKEEQAAALGIDGMTATTHAAYEALEAAAASLVIGYDATGGAASTAGEITVRTATGDTIGRLDTVIDQLDQAASAVDTAIGSADHAQEYAQQLEIETLIVVVTAAADSLSGARQAVEAATKRTEAYRHQVEALGN